MDDINEIEMKVCNKCGLRKPITNFVTKGRRKNGHLRPRSSTCRSCSTQAGGTGMTPEKKLKVLQRDNYTCHYCGEYGDTIDHILPKSKGGKNGMYNLVCACRKCNEEREDMCYEEFKQIKR